MIERLLSVRSDDEPPLLDGVEAEAFVDDCNRFGASRLNSAGRHAQLARRLRRGLGTLPALRLERSRGATGNLFMGDRANHGILDSIVDWNS